MLRFKPEELDLFVNLLLDKGGFGFLNRIENLDNFSQENFEEMSKNIEQGNLINFLKDLKVIVSHLGSNLVPYYKKIIYIAMFSLSHFYHKISTQKIKKSKKHSVEGRKFTMEALLEILHHYDFNSTGSDNFLDTFINITKSGIEKMSSDSAVNVSGLLYFFSEISKAPSIFEIFVKKDNSILEHVISCLQSSSEKVYEIVIRILHSILIDEEAQEDEEMEEESTRSELLKNIANKNITQIVGHLHTKKLNYQIARLSDSEFQLLAYFSEIAKGEDAEKIVEILLPQFQNRFIFSETKISILSILEKMIDSLPKVHKFIPHLAKQFYYCKNDHIFRDKLASMFQKLSIKLPHILGTITPLIKDINSFKENMLGRKDYEKRTEAHLKIISIYNNKEKIDINAVYLIFYNYLYQLEDFDYAVQENILNAFSSFFHLIQYNFSPLKDSKKMAKIVNMSENESIENELTKIIYTVISMLKNGMKNKKRETSEIYLKVFKDFLTNVESGHTFHDLRIFSSKKKDLFSNLSHIQVTKRVAILEKFVYICKNNSSEVKWQSINSIILPILIQQYVSEISVSKIRKELTNSIGEAIGAVSLLLPWKTYYSLIKTISDLLSKTKRSSYIGKLIQCIVKNFHFDMEDPIYSLQQFNKNQQLEEAENLIEFELSEEDQPNQLEKEDKEDKKEDGEEENSQMSEEDEEKKEKIKDKEEIEEKEEEKKEEDVEEIKERKKRNEEVHKNIIQERIIKIIIPNLFEHMRNKKKGVEERLYIGVPIIQLLSLLGEQYVYNRAYLICKTITNSMANKDFNVREITRNCLAQVSVELKSKLFHVPLQALKSSLVKGFQKIVLPYSLNKLLTSVSQVWGVGEFDENIGLMVPIFLEDIFGETKEKKDVDRIKSLHKEAKFETSFNSFEIIASKITFHKIEELLFPVSDILKKFGKMSIVDTCNKLLDKIRIGISRNGSVTQEDLLVLTYRLIGKYLEIHIPSTIDSNQNVHSISYEGTFFFFLINFNFWKKKNRSRIFEKKIKVDERKPNQKLHQNRVDPQTKKKIDRR